MPDNRIIICETCNSAVAGSVSIQEAVEAVTSALETASLHHQFRVEKFPCMGGCESPITVSLQGKDMATVVFSGVQFPADVDDLIATCRTYLNSPKGWIEDARPCGRLRLCLRSRVPAL